MRILFIVYKKYISKILHSLVPVGGCRFYPTCSEYFLLSVKKHGIIKGSYKGLLRFFSCNPLSKGGVCYP